MTARQASCTCGDLRLTAHGEPVRVSVCHCLACQRRTGSAFGVQARFALDRVTVTGEASEFSRTGDAGASITFRFCPRCGDTQSYEIDAFPGWIMVPVGAFADPAFPPPTASVYEDRCHPWVEVHGLLERMR